MKKKVNHEKKEYEATEENESLTGWIAVAIAIVRFIFNLMRNNRKSNK